MNLALWLERTAAVAGGRPALFVGARQVADYAGFYRSAMGLASGLKAHGITPGDRVAMFMKNGPEYLIAFYGIWAAGAVVVPINAKLHPKEVAYILENAGAKLALVTPDLAAGLADATQMPLVDVSGKDFAAMCAGPGLIRVVARAPEDLAWLFYTSGTTGKPKGVRISHGMILATSLAVLPDVDEVRAEDAAFYMAPLSHGAGIYVPIHVRRGARHICPESGGFDVAELLETAKMQGPLSMFMAPTMIRRLTDVAKATGQRGDGIKTIIYGGGPMYLADIIEAVDWFGAKFVQIYGQGECPMAITSLSRADVADRSHPRWRQRLASVGRAQSVVEVAIGAPDARLPAGEIGEIIVRGLPVMPGYWENSEASAKTLVDGWLMTGDMGALDEDGYLTLKDRSKDVIISGGTNIYPREVEEALLTHDAVHEVSVIGRASDEWGEDVVAFVVLRPGMAANKADLDAHCLAQIARFKRPKAYFFVPELPKSNYGKILKRALRRLLEEGKI